MKKILFNVLVIFSVLVLLGMVTVITSTFFVKDYAYTYDTLQDKYEMTSCQVETEWKVSYILNIRTVNEKWNVLLSGTTPNDTPVICNEGTYTYLEYQQAFEIWEAERIKDLLDDTE